jgi:hypothetical protein
MADGPAWSVAGRRHSEIISDITVRARQLQQRCQLVIFTSRHPALIEVSLSSSKRQFVRNMNIGSGGNSAICSSVG